MKIKRTGMNEQQLKELLSCYDSEFYEDVGLNAYELKYDPDMIVNEQIDRDYIVCNILYDLVDQYFTELPENDQDKFSPNKKATSKAYLKKCIDSISDNYFYLIKTDYLKACQYAVIWGNPEKNFPDGWPWRGGCWYYYLGTLYTLLMSGCDIIFYCMPDEDFFDCLKQIVKKYSLSCNLTISGSSIAELIGMKVDYIALMDPTGGADGLCAADNLTSFAPTTFPGCAFILFDTLSREKYVETTLYNEIQERIKRGILNAIRCEIGAGFVDFGNVFECMAWLDHVFNGSADETNIYVFTDNREIIEQLNNWSLHDFVAHGNSRKIKHCCNDCE